MQTQAAVLWGAKQDWKIETVDLGEPVRHEVRVKLAASGLCHSDEHMVTGDAYFEHYPLVGGHEGAGVVEAVGPGVETLAVGDHVVLSWIPSCGRCRPCVLGWQNLCDNGAALLSGKALADGTNRIHVGDTPVTTFCMLGAFAQYVVVHEYSAVKIDQDLPLDKAALVGCGVTTGYGSAVNAGEVRSGRYRRGRGGRRHRHVGRAGRPDCWRQPDRRRRPGGLEAGRGEGLRSHA